MPKQRVYGMGYDPGKIRRETTWRMVWLGLFSLGIVVLVFWLGLVLYPLSVRLPGSAQNAPVEWGNLDGITSLLTMALVFGGLVFAFVDAIQSAVEKKQQDAQASYGIFKDVFDRVMSEQAQASRRWVILHIPVLEGSGMEEPDWLALVHERLNVTSDGGQGERPQGLEHLKDILNTLDFVGFVGRHYWSMENELIYWLSPSVSKVWERIGPFVENEALRRNEPDYYEAAREFGNACLQYRRAHFDASKIIEDAT